MDSNSIPEQGQATPEVSELMKTLTPQPGESPASFLMRGSIVLGNFSSVSMVKPVDTLTLHADELVEAAANLPASSPTERLIRSADTIELLHANVVQLGLLAPIEAGASSAEAYDGTQRDRRMFTVGRIGRRAASEETYSSMLYAASGSPEVHSNVARSLDGKHILNLGGGNSRLQRDLEEAGVSNVSVKNIEPYPSQRVLESPEEYDELIALKPTDADFIEKSGLQPGEADEIVAAYSVPAYLGTEEEVIHLFNNVSTLLAPGGVARIAPLGIVGAQEGDPRIGAMINSLQNLAEQKYLVEAIVTPRRILLLITAPE